MSRPALASCLRPLPLLVALLAALPLSPHAQEAPAQHSTSARQAFNLPAGPLAETLNAIARSTGLSISLQSHLAAGRQAPAIQGNLTGAEALARALAGSNLEAVRNPQGGYTLRARPQTPVAQLAPVTVAGQTLDAPTEGTSSYTAAAVSVGSKLPTAIRDVPQSVSVATRQQLDDQGLNTLESAMAQMTGVTVNDENIAFSSGFSSRGFAITNVQSDGGATLFRGNYYAGAPDLALYDRVELLRGADGLFNGVGEPGGTINLVRKRPTQTPQWQVEGMVGRWNQRRVVLDGSTPLGDDNSPVRARLVALHDAQHTFWDNGRSRKTLFYGIVEADLGPDTTLALGGNHERADRRPFVGGLPRYTNGGDLGLPRNTSAVPDWAYNHLRSRELFANLAHQFNERWSLRLNATHVKQDYDILHAMVYGAVDPVDLTGPRGSSARMEWGSRQRAIDVNLTGSIDWLGRSHDLIAGYSWQDVQATYADYQTVGDSVPVDWFNPGADLWPEPSSTYKYREWPEWPRKQIGAYVAARAQVTDALRVIGGLRYSRFESGNTDVSYNADGVETRRRVNFSRGDGVVTPHAALVYTLSPSWTTYASYAQTHLPQANRVEGPPPGGKQLDPVRGTNYEIGLKGELWEGRAQTALALYRIERKGEAQRDGRYPNTPLDLGVTCCWLDNGHSISQGVDLEISGEVLTGWQVMAGYTFNDNRNRNAENVRFSTRTPRHLFKLWSTYQLPGPASAWRIGAGLTVQSHNYVSGNASTYNPATDRFDGPTQPFSFVQGGYAVASAMVEYRFQPDWSATLNIGNLFDHTYYRTVGGIDSGSIYGEPRNVSLTVRGRF